MYIYKYVYQYKKSSIPFEFRPLPLRNDVEEVQSTAYQLFFRMTYIRLQLAL